jgi:hypothetical protein
MRIRLLAGCAIAALSATGSFAADFSSGYDNYYSTPQPQSSGAASVFGDINLSAIYFGGDIPDDVSLDLGGSIVLPFANGWNAALVHQLGYLFNAHDWDAEGTGHLFYGNRTWAAGGFVGWDTDDTYGGGAEAAAFVGNVDVIGKVGYFNSSTDFWSADGTVNVYFDPNTAVSAGLGGVWYDSGSDGWAADIGVEHRFNASPVSAFADLGWTDAGGPDVYAATLGARYVFGDSGPTLQDFNRRNPF